MPWLGEFAQCRRIDFAAKRRRLAEPDVIQQDDEDVGRVLGQMTLLNAPPMNQILQAAAQRRSLTAPAETEEPSRLSARRSARFVQSRDWEWQGKSC